MRGDANHEVFGRILRRLRDPQGKTNSIVFQGFLEVANAAESTGGPANSTKGRWKLEGNLRSGWKKQGLVIGPSDLKARFLGVGVGVWQVNCNSEAMSTRVLEKKLSRERSPHRDGLQPPSSSAFASPSLKGAPEAAADDGGSAAGQSALLLGLNSRPELVV